MLYRPQHSVFYDIYNIEIFFEIFESLKTKQINDIKPEATLKRHLLVSDIELCEISAKEFTFC